MYFREGHWHRKKADCARSAPPKLVLPMVFRMPPGWIELSLYYSLFFAVRHELTIVHILNLNFSLLNEQVKRFLFIGGQLFPDAGLAGL
jgi:hypothetical protein